MNNKWMKAFLDYLDLVFYLIFYFFPSHILPSTPAKWVGASCWLASFPLSTFLPLLGEPFLYVLLSKFCLSSAPQLKGSFTTSAKASQLGPISPSSGCRGCLAPLPCRFPNSARSLQFFVLHACVFFLQGNERSLRATTAWFVCVLHSLGLYSMQRKAQRLFLGTEKSRWIGKPYFAGNTPTALSW